LTHYIAVSSLYAALHFGTYYSRQRPVVLHCLMANFTAVSSQLCCTAFGTLYIAFGSLLYCTAFGTFYSSQQTVVLH
jgi:hypothetical protein